MFAMESSAYFARTFREGNALLESFRFEQTRMTTRRTTFNFKFSLLFSKIDTPQSFIVLFFTTKVSMLISVEGVQGLALSRSLNDIIPCI